MERTQQTTPNTETKSPETLSTRTVAGNEVAVVRSLAAAVACIQSGPTTVVLDLTHVAVPNQQFVRWFLNMTHHSHRLLLTGSDEIPVAPILIDGLIRKPLSDDKLETHLTEFAYRDQYATALSEYTQCVCQDETGSSYWRQQVLRNQLSELRAELDDITNAGDVSAFDRTMREIL